MIEMLAYAIAAGLTAVCCVVHYAAMRWLYQSPGLGRLPVGVLFFVGAMLLVHVFEIWLFGLAYYLMSGTVFGSVSAAGFLDCIYYSASAYTTLGLGDIFPTGPIRAVTGTEGLVGLVLIAWTASFTFLHMQRFWDRDDDR